MTKRFGWQAFVKTPNLLSVFIKLSLILFFLCVVFFQDFGQLLRLAMGNTEVQYILIVPLVAGFFFYTQRRAFLFPRKNSKLHDFIGALTCLLALLIYIYGSYSLYPVELHLLTLPFFAAGLILLLFGSAALKSLAFPVGLLVFASPFPIIFSDQYGGYLINSTTTISSAFLKIFLPITYSLQPTAIINTVTMSGHPISFEIAPACSGIYSLIAMTFFAVIFLYIVSGSWLRKIFLATLSIVAAFLLNIFRVVLTVTIGYTVGYGTALEFFHDFAGLVLLLFGVVLLLVVSDRFLKLSFMKENTPDCIHPNQITGICSRCGKIFEFPNKPLNWKRIGIICLFALVLMALFLQASAATYNVASNDKNRYIPLNLNTGNTTAFSGLTGWTSQFMERETGAEGQLGLNYVGDYALTTGNGSLVNAILEVSDAQSKFHTWEGCLYYQSTPMTIMKTNVLTLYNQNNTLVTAESMVANVPAYGQKLILVYWFDSVNLQFNNTVSAWALKLTLYQFIGNTTDATQTVNGLIQLGAQLESSWTIYKNPMQGFAVNIYQNINPAFIFITGLLATAIVFSFFSSTVKSRSIAKKTNQLTQTDKQLIDKLATEKSTSKAVSQLENQPKLKDRIERLNQLGFLQERYVLINSQPYVRWKAQQNNS